MSNPVTIYFKKPGTDTILEETFSNERVADSWIELIKANGYKLVKKV